MRVWQIGLNKTGSNSLCEALKILGFNTLHNSKCDRQIIQLLHDKTFDNSEFSEYNGFLDDRYNRYYKWLAKEFPDDKFIFTVRNVDDWINSRIIHVLYNRLTNRSKWLNINTNMWKREFELLNKEVNEFFATTENWHRLLTINICDDSSKSNWSKLCHFLDITNIPEEEFPVANKSYVKLHQILDHYE